jgi:alpha-galactosidase
LDPATDYRVEVVPLSAGSLVKARSGLPGWLTTETSISGALLASIGLPGPMLYPEQALVFRLTAQARP